eukprot:3227253-Rhodomonas_salina.3
MRSGGGGVRGGEDLEGEACSLQLRLHRLLARSARSQTQTHTHRQRQTDRWTDRWTDRQRERDPRVRERTDARKRLKAQAHHHDAPGPSTCEAVPKM